MTTVTRQDKSADSCAASATAAYSLRLGTARKFCDVRLIISKRRRRLGIWASGTTATTDERIDVEFEEKHFLVVFDHDDQREEMEVDGEAEAYRKLDTLYRSRRYRRGHYERRMTVRAGSFARAGI